jgi:putative CocE/NonD family hydrolase
VKYSAIHCFSHYLLGLPNGFDALKPVAYYVMGDTSGDARANPGNEWRYADAWPIPVKETPLYLRPDARLTREKPPAAEGDPALVEYTFDPAKPCPTVGGCNLTLPKGPMNQNRVEQRNDVLTFTTGKLKSPLEVTGHVVAKLFVSSSEADTDLSVRFCDVYPGGASYLMAEGMLRLRYRHGFAKPVPLRPHETVEVTVKLWPTSIVFNKGHRIRVSVTSSNYPRFDVNPGTGKPYRKGGKLVKQINRIYCDGRYPSRVLLPVVPTGQPAGPGGPGGRPAGPGPPARR